MTTSYLWHLWPGRHWPASLQEETALLADLESRTKRVNKKFERSDVTALLNILRLGLTIDEVLPYAPGLKFDRLLGAARHIEQLRTLATTALIELIDDPTEENIAHFAKTAAQVAPAPTYRIVTAVREYHDNPTPANADRLEKVVAAIDTLIDQAQTTADQLEAHLEAFSTSPRSEDSDAKAVELGRALYDPYDECIWGSQFYIPRRLTDLLPYRVSDLLGEVEQ